MNKCTVLIGFAFLILTSCKIYKKILTKEHTKNTEKEIHNLLNSWHKAAEDANYAAYFNKMDSTAIFIGTDASENWKKKQFEKFSKPYFEKGKAWNFTPLERSIYIDKTNSFAWFDELLNTWMGICRGSGVLERNNNHWKIKHYVLSVTIPNDDIQKVIHVKKTNDSLFISKNNY
ncbi:nuclear transport factor 2 family protein [Tenacibaculum maritimum]|uniref:nuclear transport factor 2 family protein n=1 Tax=Tenacibaculum maritimum TaxID=107401 RepID=UPI00388D4698